MNKKRSIYNISTGILSQLLSIALGIIIPRLFLTNYGSEMNGLMNSVVQAFVYLSLLEAGVGGASLHALYHPVAMNDKKAISSILSATNHYYKKTGIFYAVGVVLLAFTYPLISHSSIPPYTIISIILLSGIPGVVSYIIQGKYALLLQAEGKNYIIILLSTCTNTLVSFTKIGLLIYGSNIILLQASCMSINLISVIIICVYMRRNYKWLNLNEIPNFSAISQKNAVLINQVSDLIFRNTGIILLTLFCNLKIVSVYALYTLLFSMIRVALDHVAKGVAFVMGQTYNTNIDLFVCYHDIYETYRMSLIFALYSIAFIFILPFMKLYTSGITDANYIDYKVAALFVITYLMSGARACEADLINYAQHFKQTQGRCIIEAIINIVVSLACIQLWGIYGVLAGTIVALAYRTNDMIFYANRRLLNRSPWITYRRWFINSVLFISIIYISNFIPWDLSSYPLIILWATVSSIIILCLYWSIASLTNYSSFKYITQIISRKYRLRY